MPDRIYLDIDIINMRFGYSDTNTVSDVEYPDLDTDRSKPLETDSVLNTVGKYTYRFHPWFRPQGTSQPSYARSPGGWGFLCDSVRSLTQYNIRVWTDETLKSPSSAAAAAATPVVHHRWSPSLLLRHLAGG
jgi:hypothetical protein